MRKITKLTAQAFHEERPITMGNTYTDGTTYYLHNNAIARQDYTGLEITTAGWDTMTTRERLNGILAGSGVRVFKQNGNLFISSKNRLHSWGGEWFNVTEMIQDSNE